MFNFAGRLLFTGLCINASFVSLASAASLEMGVSAEIIEAQSGIVFVSSVSDKYADTEVVRALFAGCGERWKSLALGQDSESEFELMHGEMKAELPGRGCGRALRLNNRGRIINVESKTITIRGRSVMSVKIHL